MNSFVDRFSATGPISELRKAHDLAAEDGEFSDSMWGSEAGFGSLSNGVPTFPVPAVADVSFLTYCRVEIKFTNGLAFSILEATHRRPCRSGLQN
jgi:hypothetical protein